ncbi:MAG: FG-GAP repeat domain-containing protein [Rhodothermales bacterium]
MTTKMRGSVFFTTAMLVVMFAGCTKSTLENVPPEYDDFTLVKYNNPDAVVDLGAGLWAWPLPIDYDKDGDMDLLISTPDTPYNGLHFFENKTGGTFPVFEPPVKLSGAIKNVQLSVVDNVPYVLVPGAVLEDFYTDFDTRPRALYPTDSITQFITKGRFNQWKLVDYEGDGDLDILVGVDDWGDYGWDNAFDGFGNWTNGPLHGYVYLIENQEGSYVNRGQLEAGGAPIDVYGAPTPNMSDFDGDGDLDLITGEFIDRLTWFENVGSRQRPVFASGRFLANAMGIVKMDLQMIIPVSVDWDGDSDIDLVIGDEDGRVALVENMGEMFDGMPHFSNPRYFQQKADNLKFGALSTPFSVDWDNDGDEDIISGNTAGYIAFIENLDGGYPPQWAPPELLHSEGQPIRIQSGKNGSIQGPAEAKWGYTTLSVADWDGDGLKDVIVNSIWGKVLWFRNMGTSDAPRLDAAQPVLVDWGDEHHKPAWNWWNPEPNTLATQWRTTPFATDWNQDGLTDLVMLDKEGFLTFFERFEKEGRLMLHPGSHIFIATDSSGYTGRQSVSIGTPGALQLNTGLYGKSGRRKFTFTDWDGDNDLDLLVNSDNISLMENVGVVNGKVNFRNAGMVAKRKLAGHTTSPTIVDWDRDGIPDLFVGGEDGHFYYLENPNRN